MSMQQAKSVFEYESEYGPTSRWTDSPMNQPTMFGAWGSPKELSNNNLYVTCKPDCSSSAPKTGGITTSRATSSRLDLKQSVPQAIVQFIA
jgi:hypothetical protein